ncbi:MAG: hypothetical protein D4R65_00780 [Verrucomicrobiaceae bacterium]|nr:MAG: hypothetical protein D4R65_00780 [Verrucomicrobiaceae bacterium]
MTCYIKTTISIEDHLLDEAKRVSLERRCSLGELVEEALRLVLATRPKQKSMQKIRPFKTFRGTGLQSGVDLSSNAGLLDG